MSDWDKQIIAKQIEEEIALLAIKDKAQLSRELQLIDHKIETRKFAKAIAEAKYTMDKMNCPYPRRQTVQLCTLSQICGEQTIQTIVAYVQSCLPDEYLVRSNMPYHGYAEIVVTISIDAPPKM